MTGDPLERYVSRVAAELPFGPSMRARIVREVRAYLLDAADDLERSGLTGSEAREIAVSRFGSPYSVARRFAESRGVMAVPTTLTRWSGFAAILGAIVASFSMLLQFVTTYEQVWTDGVGFVGAVLMAIGLVGMHLRQRGTYGSIGRLGFRLLPAAVALAGVAIALYSGLLFFFAQLLGAIGVVMIAAATWRAGILPRHGLAVAVAGFAVILGANWLPDNPAYIVGEPWDWVAVLGVVLFGAGWIVVGSALWREEAEVLEATSA